MMFLWCLGILLIGVALMVGLIVGVPKSVSSSTGSSTFMASAAVGDPMIVKITGTVMEYTNLAQYNPGETPQTIVLDITTDANGYATFSDPSLEVGVIFPDDYLLLGSKRLGKNKNTIGFALGLIPKPYTTATFPRRVMNYMQFRTGNRGFEIGFIDSTNIQSIQHQYWDSEEGWGEQTQMDIQPDTFTLSDNKLSISFTEEENGEQNVITIFQTTGDDVVLDMDNGSIYAVPEASTDSLTTGVYRGLLYGKNNAQAQPDNTELGEGLIVRFHLDVSASNSFEWVEETNGESKVVASGTLERLTGQQTTGAPESYSMIGALCFQSDGKTVVVVKNDTDAKVLCGYYEGGSNGQYTYRHGAARLV